MSSSSSSLQSFDSVGWDAQKQVVMVAAGVFSVVLWCSGNVLLAALVVLVGEFKFVCFERKMFKVNLPNAKLDHSILHGTTTTQNSYIMKMS